MSELQSIYGYCNLLQYEEIKNELNNIIKDYDLDKVREVSGQWICYLKREKDTILLNIKNNEIAVSKVTLNTVERIVFSMNLVATWRIIEKREQGLVYTTIKKEYERIKDTKRKLSLFSVKEKNHVFTWDNIGYETSNKLMEIYYKLRLLDYSNNLKDMCDLYSDFTVFRTNLDKKNINDNISVYVNEHNISDIYEFIKGVDSVERIYYLYEGLITPINEQDIYAINQGRLNQKAFALKELLGINKNIDMVVGKVEKSVSQEYIQYIESILKNRFNYTEKIELNRNEIIKGVIAKRIEEDKPKEIENISLKGLEKLVINETNMIVSKILKLIKG